MRISEEELTAHLLRIDTELAQAGHTIPQRPMHAIMRMGEALSLPLPISDPRGFQHESSANWYITQFIDRWYNARYGDRVKHDFSPGLVAIDIRRDIYVVPMPLVFGAASFFARAEPGPKTGAFSRHPPHMNVLDAIKDLTPAIRGELSPEELNYILKLFVLGVEVSHLFKGLASTSELPGLARADIDAAATHLSDLRREYPLSKWASLQATEKVLKYGISMTGRSYKANHDLDALLGVAASAGFAADIQEAVGLIQCSPGVRYGAVKVSEIEALDAHHASLVACRELLAWALTARSTARR